VRIHYRTEGSGPPLVLQHGFTSSIESWYEYGYVDVLKHEYRLILVDSRGHGASDKPHDSAAYRLERRVGDVVAVLDALAVEKAHFWGYSMGGWIGFGMAEFAPARVDRLVIGGQHPYAKSLALFREMMQTGIAQGRDAFAAAVEQAFGTLSPAYIARLREADHKAYLAHAQDRTSLESLLPKMAMPCCLYVGESDRLSPCNDVKAASRLIPHARFFSLPDLNHLQAMVRSDLVLPCVMPFLQGAT
jgi:pimeloyl-ACP methyl ester carboxylesterase